MLCLKSKFLKYRGWSSFITSFNFSLQTSLILRLFIIQFYKVSGKMAVIFLRVFFGFFFSWIRERSNEKKGGPLCISCSAAINLTDLKLDFTAIKINFKTQVIFNYTYTLKINVGATRIYFCRKNVLVLSLWKIPSELNTCCLNQPLNFNRNGMVVMELNGTNETILEKKSFF